MVAGAPSLNPHGRPPRGRSIAERVRALIDPDELIAFLQRVVSDPKTQKRDALAAVNTLLAYGYGKPESTTNLKLTDDRDRPLPASWPTMSPTERGHWIDSIEAPAAKARS